MKCRRPAAVAAAAAAFLAVGHPIVAQDADITLDSITVDGTSVAGFDDSRIQVLFPIGIANAAAAPTIVGTPTEADAKVTYGVTDASEADGHQVSVEAGSGVEVRIAVENPTSEKYYVRVDRGLAGAYQWKAADDFYGLRAAGNRMGYGAWSDGECGSWTRPTTFSTPTRWRRRLATRKRTLIFPLPPTHPAPA